MKKKALAPHLLLLWAALVCGLTLTGCGSSNPQPSSPPPADITVSLSASSTSVTAGQTVNITATTNDSKGVKWTLSGQGSLSGAETTSVTYSAPSSVSTGFIATVTATSVSDPKVSKSAAVDVLGGRLAILNDSLPNGVLTVLYANSAVVSGGLAPYTFSVSNGSLPAGLSILGNSNGTPYSSGTIYGTPKTAATSYFTLTVTDSASPPDVATQDLSLTINPATGLTISTLPLNNGIVGFGYVQQPAISGGTQPYTVNITAGSLPPGLGVSEGYLINGTPTGQICCIPKTAGTYNFTYQATDSSYPPNVANANFSIKIYPAGTLAILTTALPSGTVGSNYAPQTPLVAGGTPPYTFNLSAGILPPGLALSASTGTISGVPTTAGTYSFTYAATDSAIFPQTATSDLSIQIASVPPAPTITTTSLPDASVGLVYVSPPIQATGGTPPYTFSISPPSQNSATGTISFVPTSAGVQNFTVSVTDSLGGSDSTTLNVTVDPANCPNNANLQGSYAMLFNGPAVMGESNVVAQSFVGTFVADGAGNNGAYCIGPANQGTLSLGNVYLLNLNTSGNADIIVYQNPPPGTLFPFQIPFGFGTLAKQDTTAFSGSNFVGQYSFGLSGGTALGDNIGLSQAGTFSSDGNGNLSNGELDEQGSNLTNVTFTANDFAVAPSGAGTVTLNESNGTTVSETFVVVNSSELFAAAPAYLVGPIVQNTGGPYSNSSLNGVSVFGSQGAAGVPGLPLMTQIGLITWDGAGTFTLTADRNQSGTLTTVSYNGTYSVDADGRVTLVSSGESSPPIFYLSGPNQGFIVSIDDSTNGQFFAQSGGPFESSSFSGSYLGSMLNTYAFANNSCCCCSPGFETELDNFSADGVSDLTGISYLDDQWNGPLAVPVSSTYTVASSGRGVVSANGNQTNIFYIVSPTQVLMMPSAAQYPKVMSLTQP